MLSKLNNPEITKRVVTCVVLGHDWKPHSDNVHRVCMRCNKIKEEV